MLQPTEDILQDYDVMPMQHCPTGKRVGALIIDGILLSALSYSVITFTTGSFTEATHLNEFYIGTIFVSLFTIIYHPFMEFKFGATVGKLIMKIKVVNTKYEKIDIRQAVLRNIFTLVPNVISITTAALIVAGVDLGSYSKNNVNFYSSIEGILSALLTIIDVIYYFNSSLNQALHDTIAGTYVVVNK